MGFVHCGQTRAGPITLSFRQLKVINLSFAPTTPGTYSATVTATGEDGTHTMAVSALTP